jgi:hypothetical protein
MTRFHGAREDHRDLIGSRVTSARRRSFAMIAQTETGVRTGAVNARSVTSRNAAAATE